CGSRTVAAAQGCGCDRGGGPGGVRPATSSIRTEVPDARGNGEGDPKRPGAGRKGVRKPTSRSQHLPEHRLLRNPGAALVRPEAHGSGGDRLRARQPPAWGNVPSAAQEEAALGKSAGGSPPW